MTPNADGANVIRDFSGVTLLLNAGTTTFMEPGATPYAADYPTSNVAQEVVLPGGTSYSYFNLTTVPRDMLGEGIGGSDPTVYTDPKTPLQFPLSYPNYFIDYYAFGGTDYGVSRAYMGNGAVILPTRTFNDVLKMASTSGAIDFFRSNPVSHLVKIDKDGTVLVFESLASSFAQAATPAVLEVFPQPATDAVRVSGLTNSGSWQLFDMQGRSIEQGKYTPGILELNLGTLPSGPYTLWINAGTGRRSLRIIRQ